MLSGATVGVSVGGARIRTVYTTVVSTVGPNPIATESSTRVASGAIGMPSKRPNKSAATGVKLTQNACVLCGTPFRMVRSSLCRRTVFPAAVTGKTKSPSHLKNRVGGVAHRAWPHPSAESRVGTAAKTSKLLLLVAGMQSPAFFSIC